MAFYGYGQPVAALHNPESYPSSLYSGQLGASPPGQMDTSGYLPPFLLGSTASKSPSRSRGGFQVSGAGLTPGGMRTTTTSPGRISLLDQSHIGIGPSMGSIKMEPSRKATAAGGPPVQSLYDRPPSPARTSTPLLPATSPERRQLSFNVMNTGHRTGRGGILGGGTPGTVGPMRTSTPGTVGGLDMSVVGTRQRTPPSPAQMDPFYTQGEDLTSEDDYHECWVTIFGFPPAASSYILEQFSQYGTILKHVVTSNGNWMHFLYQSRLQAKKALSKNGKVYGNGIMVGVQPCIDKSVIEGYAPSPASPGPSLSALPSTPSKKPTSIRPLTAAYQASSSAHQVAPCNPNTPQKSTGFFAKALEYMFGW